MPRSLRDLPLGALILACLLAAGFGPSSPAAPPPAGPRRAVVSRTPPVYPELALRMRIGGEVVVRAIILPDGTVSETHIESGHALLRQAAEDAVKHWRFVTAVGAMASECLVTVSFDPSGR
jgi:TonB family protein